jgi:hypothetical protein
MVVQAMKEGHNNAFAFAVVEAMIEDNINVFAGAEGVIDTTPTVRHQHYRNKTQVVDMDREERARRETAPMMDPDRTRHVAACKRTFQAFALPLLDVPSSSASTSLGVDDAALAGEGVRKKPFLVRRPRSCPSSLGMGLNDCQSVFQCRDPAGVCETPPHQYSKPPPPLLAMRALAATVPQAAFKNAFDQEGYSEEKLHVPRVTLTRRPVGWDNEQFMMLHRPAASSCEEDMNSRPLSDNICLPLFPTDLPDHSMEDQENVVSIPLIAPRPKQRGDSLLAFPSNVVNSNLFFDLL